MKKMASGCFALAALLLVGFGVTYLIRSEFMPFHAKGLGIAWTDLDPGFQVLLLALMRAVGGGAVGAGAAILILLALPFRRGEAWASGAILTVGLLAAVPYAYAMHLFRTHTPADPPIAAPIAGILLLGIGFLLSRRRTHTQAFPNVPRDRPETALLR